jgi:hypothetical protein
MVGSVTVGTTLASNISLNAGAPVEFGQGVMATTACDENGIMITPQATFVNNGDDSDFLFTMLTVTDVSSDCDGKTFTIKAYKNGQNTALALYQTNGTPYYEINVNSIGGSFSFGEGGLESGDEVACVVDLDGCRPHVFGLGLAWRCALHVASGHAGGLDPACRSLGGRFAHHFP